VEVDINVVLLSVSVSAMVAVIGQAKHAKAIAELCIKALAAHKSKDRG
jgi:hypothetical protein